VSLIRSRRCLSSFVSIDSFHSNHLLISIVFFLFAYIFFFIFILLLLFFVLIIELVLMYSLHMFSEMFPPEVSSLTLWVGAPVGPQTRMNHLMTLHIRTISKILATTCDGTTIRLLTGVNTHMTLEGGLFSERLRTTSKRAFERFLS